MLSTRKLYKLWREFNEAVFSGQLTRPRIVLGPVDQDVTDELGKLWAYCEAEPGQVVLIHISDECPGNEVEATLLHEMVHQYQAQVGIALDHGPSFEAWRAPCRAITGLEL